jgi:hypothetical protein
MVDRFRHLRGPVSEPPALARVPHLPFRWRSDVFDPALRTAANRFPEQGDLVMIKANEHHCATTMRQTQRW